MVICLSANDLENKLREVEGYSLITFTAPWCSPCKRLEPTVENLANEKEHLNIFRINIDDDPILASRFGVRSIPNLLLVKDGKPVSIHAGRASLGDIKTWLEVHGV